MCIEREIVALPSNSTLQPVLGQLELHLRQEQANTHLNRLRDLIADKSFQYSHIIRSAPRKSIRNHARTTIKNLNHEIAFHARVYAYCRAQMISLGASEETMHIYRVLTRDDIKASTAVLNPNIPGSTQLKLSWIWHSTLARTTPIADPHADDVTHTECMVIHFLLFICCINNVTVKRVHWLRARAQMHRWKEELTFVNYEMQWTVTYFLYQSGKWQQWMAGIDASPDADATSNQFPGAGSRAYATRKTEMWHHLAQTADHCFRAINPAYKSQM
jgi:hypothetical protein